MLSQNFALIGSSGYVAPRHLKAIQGVGGRLLAALDPHDAAGILDAYFPQAAFFTEFERFDRHLEKAKRNSQPIDFLSVCSPNYLHDAHTRYGLRYGANVICEKPLALHPRNLDALRELENETGKRVWNLLQLRHHPRILELKKQVEARPADQISEVELSYITPRGQWYHASWKGDPAKSGGIVTNIGIHLFDMLLWVFGKVQHAEIHVHTHGRAAGFLQLERARVRWFLSIEAETMPNAQAPETHAAHRSLRLDGSDWDFSEGFTELHTESYRHILAGRGWGIEAAAPGIELAWQLRQMAPAPNPETAHPMAGLPPLPHPFQG
jgi:UDP-N-acetyl-2-amino-2-deoxyglucuronate dehydrogenase